MWKAGAAKCAGFLPLSHCPQPLDGFPHLSLPCSVPCGGHCLGSLAGPLPIEKAIGGPGSKVRAIEESSEGHVLAPSLLWQCIPSIPCGSSKGPLGIDSPTVMIMASIY